MSFERRISSEQAADLDALADLLMRPRELGLLIAERFEWEPAPDSQADRDYREQQFPEAVNLLTLQRPRANASLYLRECADFLAGFGALCHARELWGSPRSLARSAVEHGVRSFHALDPRLDARARAARALLDDLISAHFSHLAVSKLGAKGTPAYATTKARSKMLRAHAKTNFKDVVIVDEPPSWSIEGERQFGFTAAVDDWCDWRGDRPSTGVYESLSLFTHPQTSVAHEGVSTDPTSGETVLDTSVAMLKTLASAGVAAWVDGARLITSFHGWDVPELDAFVADSAMLTDIDEPDRSA